MFEGRAAIGYDHGYDAQKFYLDLALDPNYIEGFVEGCLERIGRAPTLHLSNRDLNSRRPALPSMRLVNRRPATLGPRTIAGTA